MIIFVVVYWREKELGREEIEIAIVGVEVGDESCDTTPRREKARRLGVPELLLGRRGEVGLRLVKQPMRRAGTEQARAPHGPGHI
jgi:hypothetical protein